MPCRFIAAVLVLLALGLVSLSARGGAGEGGDHL